ncbi:hypothetical protein V1227_11010 [Lentzea sp. DG1S-22]|uniref:hypothetical protein n=1 Tax=Lentzea sp. DG1S-22 TaxID=3108822 RepID=UPI002E79794D|nr:hypothetical protein [Lentzea sp. DG1S-22]WVH83249.1 hypothetical protein V1227_11010 [Lentzea sp. DG1S-22]
MGNSRTTTISLPAFGVVIGVVLTLVAGFAVWKLTGSGETTTPPVTTTRDAAASPPRPVVTSSPAEQPAGGSRAREVRLARKAGADVDADGPVVQRTDGNTRATDLYLTGINLLQASGNGLFEDRGQEKDAQARCIETVATAQETPVIPAAAGLQYCFVTSEGRLAWLRVRSANLATLDSSAYLAVMVRVW